MRGTIWAAVAVLGTAGAARADVITFDDFTAGDGPAAITDGYRGFDWTNMWVLDPSASPLHAGSGYENGLVSGDYVAFNGFGVAAAVEDGTFTFNGAYLTAAWRDGLSVQVRGYSGADILFDETVVVDHFAPTFFDFDFVGIDRLTFDSFGGVEVEGLDGSGAHFAMDDFTFNASVAPLPPAALLGLGLLGGAGVLRRLRRRRETA